MIRAEVAEKRDGGQIVVLVKEVTRQWEGNKAENAKSLVGKKVLVDGRRQGRVPERTIARFLGVVKIGEVVELDVAHQRGEALTLVELTQEQRKRVGIERE